LVSGVRGVCASSSLRRVQVRGGRRVGAVLRGRVLLQRGARLVRVRRGGGRPRPRPLLVHPVALPGAPGAGRAVRGAPAGRRRRGRGAPPRQRRHHRLGGAQRVGGGPPVAPPAPRLPRRRAAHDDALCECVIAGGRAFQGAARVGPLDLFLRTICPRVFVLPRERLLFLHNYVVSESFS